MKLNRSWKFRTDITNINQHTTCQMSPLTSKTGSSCLLSSWSQRVFWIQLRFRCSSRTPHLSVLIIVRSEFLFGHVRIIVLFSSYFLFMVTILILRSAIRNIRIINLSISRHPVLYYPLAALLEANSSLPHPTSVNRSAGQSANL